MAIPFFCESFQAANLTEFLQRYVYANAPDLSLVTSGGRGGGRHLSRIFSPGYVGFPVSAGEASVLVGVRLRIPTGFTSVTRGILSIYNNPNSVNHLTLGLTADNVLQLRRGTWSGGTVLATGTTVFPFDTFFSIQLKATINATTGSYELRINGSATAEFSGTGANTQSGASSDITAIYLGSPSNDFNREIHYNDWFFTDGTASFPGDVYVDYRGVNGVGNYQQFTPSTGTDHDALLDEIPPNTTDYVSSSTTGHKETNTIQSLSGSSLTIIAVQSVNYALKSDAGSGLARNLIRSGTTDANGSTYSLSESARYYVAPHVVDPSTGVAWTSSGVNAMEVGIENVT